jgi:hypothetical protein
MFVCRILPDAMRTGMEADDLKAIIGVQLRVIICRNLAASTFDREVSRRLCALANEVERLAREVDRELCSPK